MDCFESVDFQSTPLATDAFALAHDLLAQPNYWYELASIPASTFQLHDRDGRPVQRAIQLHDYIRLDIPGPGRPSSQGYDWVNVVNITRDIKDELKVFAMTLKPCPDPQQHEHRDTAHFFEGVSSSTFVLEQRRNSILIQYAGRNEILNLANENLTDTIRNFWVGLAAKIGASYPQWKSLVKGLAERIK